MLPVTIRLQAHTARQAQAIKNTEATSMHAERPLSAPGTTLIADSPAIAIRLATEQASDVPKRVFILQECYDRGRRVFRDWQEQRRGGIAGPLAVKAAELRP